MLIRVDISIEARKMNVLGYLASAPTGTISGMIVLVLLVALWLVAYSIALYKSKNLPKLNPKSATYPLVYAHANNVFIQPLVMIPREGRVSPRIEAIKI